MWLPILKIHEPHKNSATPGFTILIYEYLKLKLHSVRVGIASHVNENDIGFDSVSLIQKFETTISTGMCALACRR